MTDDATLMTAAEARRRRVTVGGKDQARGPRHVINTRRRVGTPTTPNRPTRVRGGGVANTHMTRGKDTRRSRRRQHTQYCLGRRRGTPQMTTNPTISAKERSRKGGKVRRTPSTKVSRTLISSARTLEASVTNANRQDARHDPEEETPGTNLRNRTR